MKLINIKDDKEIVLNSWDIPKFMKQFYPAAVTHEFLLMLRNKADSDITVYWAINPYARELHSEIIPMYSFDVDELHDRYYRVNQEI